MGEDQVEHSALMQSVFGFHHPVEGMEDVSYPEDGASRSSPSLLATVACSALPLGTHQPL